MIRSRFLFLDFDGVIVNRESLSGEGARDDRINPKCVAELDRVYRTTGCAIVVSSVWRLGRMPRELAVLLGKAGYTGPVVDVTPRIPDAPRGREIYKWMGDHGVPVARMAIVDDDRDMDHLMPRLVKTEFEEGLTAAHADALIALLREAGPARVQRRRRPGSRTPANATYVGRPGRWGNPYTAFQGHGPELMLQSYREHVLEQIRTGKLDPEELRGQDLACWCPHTSPCHADELLGIVNG